MNITIATIIGYVLGSIPFGLIFTRLAGYKDIRKHGSGNIGATNVLRTTNIFLGILTLICDSGKGAIAILIAHELCNEYVAEIYTGLAAVVGHIFPIWLKFRGGKGVATALAVFVMLNPTIGIVACCLWLAAFAVTRTASLSSVFAFVVTPVAALFVVQNLQLILALLFICVLVVARHYKNLKEIYYQKHGRTMLGRNK